MRRDGRATVWRGSWDFCRPFIASSVRPRTSASNTHLRTNDSRLRRRDPPLRRNISQRNGNSKSHCQHCHTQQYHGLDIHATLPLQHLRRGRRARHIHRLPFHRNYAASDTQPTRRNRNGSSYTKHHARRDDWHNGGRESTDVVVCARRRTAFLKLLQAR